MIVDVTVAVTSAGCTHSVRALAFSVPTAMQLSQPYPLRAYAAADRVARALARESVHIYEGRHKHEF